MTKILLLAAVLFAVAACSSQYPQILQNTMAQAMPPYH